MKICVFDTETTSLNKPYVYNIGFCIADTETREILVKEDWVVEQVWHNLPLFETAYYAEKRPIYVSRMKGKAAKMEKFGFITQRMARLFKTFDVQLAFAYNSPFDVKVFDFNCDWFKCLNPFENIRVIDIRGHVHNKIAFTDRYQNFCDKNQRYTENGNYSTTAETVYQFLANDIEFVEEHTALSDSLIEFAILSKCVDKGAEWGREYKVYNSVPNKKAKELVIKTAEDEIIYPYKKIRISKKIGQTEIVLKQGEHFPLHT